MSLLDLILPTCAVIFTFADVYALYRYLPGWISRYLNRKFSEGIEQVESIIYGLFTPTEEDVIEGGKVVQPRGTVPIVAALTPLVATIPGAIGLALGETVRGALQSVKMRELGSIGNAAKQLGGLQDAALSAKDPAMAIVKPIIAEWVAGNWGKKAAGGVEVALGMIPVNLTDVLTGPVLGKLAEKFPMAQKLLEELKAANVVQTAEKIAG
jgi:hypothetical protein